MSSSAHAQDEGTLIFLIASTVVLPGWQTTMLEKIEGSAPRRMAKMPPKQYLIAHECNK